MTMYKTTKSGLNTLNHWVRYVYEIFFSINTGLAITAMVIAVAGWFIFTPLAKMETYLNNVLHIKQWDFIRGYFAFYIPALTISFLIWGLIKVCSHARLMNRFLFWIAGPLILLAMPIHWLYLAGRYGYWGWHGSQTWRLGISPLEPCVAVAVALAYIIGNQRRFTWLIILLLALHFFFWSIPLHTISFGPVALAAPFVGFFASAAWIFYINEQMAAKF